MAEKATETPLMKQYFSFKAKYPDAMLLFRVGDFYEKSIKKCLKRTYFAPIFSCSKAFHMTMPAQTETFKECFVPS